MLYIHLHPTSGQLTVDEKMTLGSALVEAIRSDGVVSLATDAAELGIDSTLAEGVLRDVPFVSSLVSLAKVGFTIRDRLFVGKLLKFLAGLNHVPESDRRSMLEKLGNDPAFAHKVGEHLLELLDRIDSHRKPYMLARVFEAYAAGRIDAKLLQRLNHAIDRIPGYEIDSVREVLEMSIFGQSMSGVSESTFFGLQDAGLIRINTGFGGGTGPTELCNVFVELDLDKTKI